MFAPYEQEFKDQIATLLRINGTDGALIAFFREAMIAGVSFGDAAKILDAACDAERRCASTDFNAPWSHHIVYPDAFVKSLVERSKKKSDAFDLLRSATATQIAFGEKISTFEQRQFAAQVLVGTVKRPKGAGAKTRKDIGRKLAMYIATAHAVKNFNLPATRGKENATFSAADAAETLLKGLDSYASFDQVAQVVTHKTDKDVRELAQWMMPDTDMNAIFGK